MANLIIKPSSGGTLKLQDEGGDDAISVSTTGNTTLAGTANALGTTTAGTLSSGVVFPTGHCLKVFSTTKTDTQTTSQTGAWNDITGLAVSVTPSATTSKVLIFGVSYLGAASGGDLMTRMVRVIGGSSVSICIGDSAGSRQLSTTAGSARQEYELEAHAFNFLDSPSTTSAVTYKMQIWGGAAHSVNRSQNDSDNGNAERTASTITVMEIAG